MQRNVYNAVYPECSFAKPEILREFSEPELSVINGLIPCSGILASRWQIIVVKSG